MGMVLRKTEISPPRLFQARGGKQFRVQGITKTQGERQLERFLVSEPLINGGSRSAGLTRHGPQGQAALSLRPPQTLCCFENPLFELAIRDRRHLPMIIRS